ncbi:hypothetical protein PAPYR_3552 [Paratrimastix pyriformis]|uniref:Uncharacterized protein n=1 Tax=Paratrimastix pyriformis TaxID=342808 RepID=A0ABQ8ULW4_9EUKA|nr:hypothetical protein PAPYR_3552 [Paratrimastix pyriformis]
MISLGESKRGRDLKAMGSSASRKALVALLFLAGEVCFAATIFDIEPFFKSPTTPMILSLVAMVVGPVLFITGFSLALSRISFFLFGALRFTSYCIFFRVLQYPSYPYYFFVAALEAALAVFPYALHYAFSDRYFPGSLLRTFLFPTSHCAIEYTLHILGSPIDLPLYSLYRLTPLMHWLRIGGPILVQYALSWISGCLETLVNVLFVRRTVSVPPSCLPQWTPADPPATYRGDYRPSLSLALVITAVLVGGGMIFTAPSTVPIQEASIPMRISAFEMTSMSDPQRLLESLGGQPLDRHANWTAGDQAAIRGQCAFLDALRHEAQAGAQMIVTGELDVLVRWSRAEAFLAEVAHIARDHHTLIVFGYGLVYDDGLSVKPPLDSRVALIDPHGRLRVNAAQVYPAPFLRRYRTRVPLQLAAMPVVSVALGDWDRTAGTVDSSAAASAGVEQTQEQQQADGTEKKLNATQRIAQALQQPGVQKPQVAGPAVRVAAVLGNDWLIAPQEYTRQVSRGGADIALVAARDWARVQTLALRITALRTIENAVPVVRPSRGVAVALSRHGIPTQTMRSAAVGDVCPTGAWAPAECRVGDGHPGSAGWGCSAVDSSAQNLAVMRTNVVLHPGRPAPLYPRVVGEALGWLSISLLFLFFVSLPKTYFCLPGADDVAAEMATAAAQREASQKKNE